jgi:hypothetical protein
MLKVTLLQTLQLAAKAKRDGAINEEEFSLASKRCRATDDETLISEWKSLLEATLRRHLAVSQHLTQPASETIRPPTPKP